MRKPTISQYLLSTCLFAIDELNEQYKNVPKEDLKNWKSTSGTSSASKKWAEFQKDFDWLINEIEKGYKNKRAFVIGWFNCVNSIT